MRDTHVALQPHSNCHNNLVLFLFLLPVHNIRIFLRSLKIQSSFKLSWWHFFFSVACSFQPGTSRHWEVLVLKQSTTEAPQSSSSLFREKKKLYKTLLLQELHERLNTKNTKNQHPESLFQPSSCVKQFVYLLRALALPPHKNWILSINVNPLGALDARRQNSSETEPQ